MHVRQFFSNGERYVAQERTSFCASHAGWKTRIAVTFCATHMFKHQ